MLFGAYAEFDPPSSADWYLLAGDDTALPAIAAVLERMPDSRVLAFVEVGDPAERLDLSVNWLCPSAGESLVSAICELSLRRVRPMPGSPVSRLRYGRFGATLSGSGKFRRSCWSSWATGRTGA